MKASPHGITLDKKNQEQPTDRDRAQDSSSKKIPGTGPQSDDGAGKIPKPEHKQDHPAEKK
jgi:hypothetical protein